MRRGSTDVRELSGRIPTPRLRRLRLAAQRLVPATAASDAHDAARATVGVQAQDVRAAALALRSRTPGIERSDVEGSGLVRTWTMRGTAHLIAPEDRAWLHSLTGPRNRRLYDRLLEKRGELELARSLLGDIVETLEGGPRSRASLLEELAARGRPALGPRAVNVAMPWAASTGLVLGLPDGRFRAADPPAPVEEDEALATLGRRYLAGYGPAGAADLASWSGLPLSVARRALDAAGELEAVGELRALPGTLDDEPPAAPAALLLAPFDTSMLGYRSREPLVASADDRHVLPGGGMVRAVVLGRGAGRGTWRLEGSGRRRRLEIEWFGRPPAAAPLRAEVRDVGRFLGLELELAG